MWKIPTSRGGGTRPGLPRGVSVQNPCARVKRVVDKGRDETMLRTGVSFRDTCWRVASALIGLTTRAQMGSDIATWGATRAPGLLAAGDYVQGPYPATLEGAVRSGQAAVLAL